MANFISPPSWLTTLRYIGHVLMPDRVEAKGFPPLSVRERREIASALTAVRVLVPAVLVLLIIMSGAIMASSIVAGLFALTFLLVGGPLLVVTILWLGLQTVVNDERDEKE